MAAPLVVPVAFDFNCEWCWVGLHQARRLVEEFGVEIEWRGYEQHPVDDPWPGSPARPKIPNRPATPSRFDLFLIVNEVDLPSIDRPKRQRTFNAHQAVEHIRNSGIDPFPLVESLFRAFWEEGRDINDPDVLAEIAGPFHSDTDGLRRAIAEGQFLDRTVKFDADAYRSGVFNIPTFWIGGERYAEQPYAVLREAVRMALAGRPVRPDPPVIYGSLNFPDPPAERPYVLLNMVETIDGKILTGGRDEPVVDLGSKLDHRLMQQIELASDAVMIGAQTLRAAKKSWNPRTEWRIVVSNSGNLPFDSCFFAQRAIVATGSRIEVPQGVEVLQFTTWEELLALLRERGIERLLAMGGSSLNAQLFERRLIDEIFVTVAPKIKLGADTPTIADGVALPRERIQRYRILEQHRVGDELFVRYRREDIAPSTQAEAIPTQGGEATSD